MIARLKSKIGVGIYYPALVLDPFYKHAFSREGVSQFDDSFALHA